MPEVAADDCDKHHGEKDSGVQEYRDRCRHQMPGTGDERTVSREEQGMGQIRKIGVTSQKREEGIEKRGIALEGEHGEEEDGGGNGVDDTGGTELMSGVDGFQERRAGRDEVVIVAHEGGEGKEEK